MTRRDLADATGLAVRTLAYHEDGTHTPSDANLEAITNALNFPIEFFFRGDPEPLGAENVSFRALSRMTAAQRDRALAGGEFALELSGWLEDKFVLPDPDVPDLRHEKSPESAAAALRSYWSLGDKPIPNVIHLIEAHGVRVFSLAEDHEAVDAFSFWKGEQPFVFLNTLKSSERSRFDAAHEIGHLALHAHATPSGREAEREADAFAAAFLMPQSSVLANQPKIRSLPALIDAKHHWGVSVSALARRMHDVGLLTDWRYRQICIEIQQHGLRKTEPEEMPREHSQVLHKVFRALRADGVPPKRVAEELGWPRQEVEVLTFRLVLASVEGGGRRHAPKGPTEGEGGIPSLKLV